MATLAEAVRELERLKHQRAVWMQTVEHLSIFIDQEVQPAQKGISAEGCIHSTVPQPVIQEFIDRINEEEIEPLNQQIEAIESMNVEEEETEDEGPEGKANEKPKRETTKEKNSRPAARKTGRKIRSLSKPPGRKAQGAG